MMATRWRATDRKRHRPLMLALRLAALALTLLASLSSSGTAQSPPSDGSPSARIEASLREAARTATLAGLKWPRFPDYRTELTSLYDASRWQPIWTTAGRPTPAAREAIAVLTSADDRALHPADYDAELLERRFAELSSTPSPGAEDVAWFDAALSVALLRHLSDVHVGRVNPRTLGVGISVEPKKQLALASLVRDVAATGRARELVQAIEPKFAQYRNLLAAYAHYRTFPDSARRVRKLELAIERIRWLPLLDDGPFVVVNVPGFQLYGFDSIGGTGAPSIEMNVVVGRAGAGRATPIFEDRMEYIVFRPYWVIPRSILRNEILPATRRSASYLARNGMELYRGDGDSGPGLPATAANLARVAQGTLGIRQKPGPRNSLGLAKFIFPNDHNVYLHGTPATELFSLARRDFSHGCIRVEDPAALAVWILRDSTQWSRAQVEAAMNGRPSRRVNLAQRIPVVVYYTTAVVRPATGAVEFYDDVYNHDARLERALAKGYPFGS
jgi:murein L,D-transpeptidase YcbB/YkuD